MNASKVGDKALSMQPDGRCNLSYRAHSGWLHFSGASEFDCQKQLDDALEGEEVPVGPPTEFNKDVYMRLVNDKLEALKDTLKRKNADYTGGDESPFSNFEVTEKLGLSDAKTGVLIRMVDKIQRIRSFIKKGKLEVKNEGVEDAVMDVIGYSLVLLGMLEQDKTRALNSGSNKSDKEEP